MEVHGSLIFWYICLGLLVGGLTKLFFGEKGRSIIVNVIGGAIAAIIAGVIAEQVGVYGTIAFSTMGSAGLLLLFNIFTLVHDPDESVVNKIEEA